MSRKNLAVIAAIAAAFMIAGCGSPGDHAAPAASPGTTAAAVAASSAPATPQARALAAECASFGTVSSSITSAVPGEGDPAGDATAVGSGAGAWGKALDAAAVPGKAFPGTPAGSASKDMLYAAVGMGSSALATDLGNAPAFLTDWSQTQADLTDAESWCAGGAAQAPVMPLDTAAPPPPKPQGVTFIVTGTPGADVTYGSSGSETQGSVPLHVTQALGTPLYYDINAQLQGGGSVTCEILVNGAVIDKQSATGGYNIANCEIGQDPITGDWQSDNG